MMNLRIPLAALVCASAWLLIGCDMGTTPLVGNAGIADSAASAASSPPTPAPGSPKAQ